MSLELISNSIRVVPNFPEEGIYFRDISTLLTKPKLYKLAIQMLVDMVKNCRIDVIAGVESRGFFLGMSIAEILEIPFVMLRKPNGIPDIVEVKCNIESGSEILTVQKNLITKGSHVLIVDDLIASGGSLIAGCQLIEKIGCHVAGCMCLIELVGMTQLEELNGYNLFTLIKLPAYSDKNYLSKENKLYYLQPIQYCPMDNISKNDNRVVVFCYPSMKSLANSIITHRKYFREGSIKWEYFSDNYPHITYENVKYLINKRIVFFGSLYDRSTFSEQLALLSVLPKQTVKSLDIFVPYFAPGEISKKIKYDTHDHGETLGTTEAYAKMMANNLYLTQDGPPRIHIFDTHSLMIKSWFGESAIVNLDSAIPSLIKKINSDLTTIVFPDAGIQERFLHQFKNFRSVCFSKYDLRIIQRNNWPSDEYDQNCFDNVLIVDDSIQYNDIFLECITELKKIGAKNISLYVTHPSFRNSSYVSFLFNPDIKKFYITNTIPEISSKLEGIAPFEVIKLDNLILDNLMDLFDFTKSSNDSEHILTEFNIYVSSHHNNELSATYDAIKQVLEENNRNNFKINVYGVNVSSNVSKQPINEEIVIGSHNKFDNLKKYVDHHNIKYDILVSIKNGVCYTGELSDDTVTSEYFNVIVMTKTEESTVKSVKKSEQFTTFPAKFLMESIRHDRNVAVGNLIEKAHGYINDTWYEHLDKKISKKEIIKNTVISAFSETCGDLLEKINNPI